VREAGHSDSSDGGFFACSFDGQYLGNAQLTLRAGAVSTTDFINWLRKLSSNSVHLESENEREELITPEREALLLKHAGQRLTGVITMVQDTGGRPEEIFRIRVEDIRLDQHHIFNPQGKTKNSRRYLPVSDRMVDLLQCRCGDRKEGWLFPSDFKCGHLDHSCQDVQDLSQERWPA
jgi:integrase